ncbi:hypothetical protein ACFFIX_06045 [Metabacillus herbersteinensis]|uniref:Uncharacterized protein n=1 Tax=Metabacillus herbersteinensis TaxID=283816 RepID=A0ABV6GBF4_9BACI
MHTKKIITAGCIFTALFSSAWYTNEKVKREYVDQVTFDTPLTEITNAETPVDFLTDDRYVLEKFKPREYVRVVSR